MKRNRLTVVVVLVVLLLSMLASLTGCLKIGMTQNSIETRLKEDGASISYVRTTPMTKDGEANHSLEDLIYSKKTYTVSVDGIDTDVEQELYIIFCGNDATASWALDACKSYLADNKTDADKWIVYNYDRVVMCGYYELVALARNY